MILDNILKLFTPREIANHLWDRSPEDIFSNDLTIAEKWLRNFPEPPVFSQKKIVEIGCGIGALCVTVAPKAGYVLGVEINREMTDTCRDIVYRNYPEMRGKIDFTEYEKIESDDHEGKFDIVLSQNAFEHYDNPEKVLRRMLALLKPGGRIYAGFGPLWNSPFGSHLGATCRIPWVHLWNGQWLINEHNRLRPHNTKSSFQDFFLNKKHLAYYENIFHDLDGTEIECFCYNKSIRQRLPVVFPIIEIFRSLPFLREYLTVSLFIVIRKVDSLAERL